MSSWVDSPVWLLGGPVVSMLIGCFVLVGPAREKTQPFPFRTRVIGIAFLGFGAYIFVLNLLSVRQVMSRGWLQALQIPVVLAGVCFYVWLRFNRR